MSFIDWFKAGPDAASKVLDAGIKGIDALVFTDEEKSAARQKMVDSWIDLQKSLGEETSIRGVTRRALAFAVVLPWLTMNIAAAVIYPLYPTYSAFLMDVAEGKFGYLVIGVMMFYFGPFMISKAMGK